MRTPATSSVVAQYRCSKRSVQPALWGGSSGGDTSSSGTLVTGSTSEPGTLLVVGVTMARIIARWRARAR